MGSPLALRWFKTLWGTAGAGAPHRTFEAAVAAAADEGWDGVTYATIGEMIEPDLGRLEPLTEQCAALGLELVVGVHTFGRTLDDHRRFADHVVPRAIAAQPRHIVHHTGLDSFSPADRAAFFHHIADYEQASGIPMCHETHRQRPLFTPWATREALAEHPDLHMVLDLSHWVVVAERLLDDIDGILHTAAPRVLHIDARVGQEEAPQIADPTDPRWTTQRAWFEAKWKMVIAAAAAAGRTEMVVVPEYGPPPYLPTAPHTGQPVVDLWSTVLREREHLKVALA